MTTRKQRMRMSASSKVSDKSAIKHSYAELKNVNDEGERPFRIGYANYREDHCRVKMMQVSPVRKVLEFYLRVGSCFSQTEVFNLPFDIKRVTVRDHYKKYISKLTPDTELNEFDAGEYRGFFFIDRSDKTIEMIAVDKHPEHKKNKK